MAAENMNAMLQSQKSLAAHSVESKELSEIKGKMLLAKQFPRDIDMAVQLTLAECSRPELAFSAQYEFQRGDSVVKGPSIRLVEVLAMNWGNLIFGTRDIEATAEGTVVEAFAWDLATNVSDTKTFFVKNERATKKSSYKLTDPRDIYENTANYAARRKRACILSLLPGWYVEQAVAACEETMKKALTSGKSMEEVRAQCVNAFKEFGVTEEQISEKIGRDVSKLTENDVARLRRLYSAIKDGFVKPNDAFGSGGQPVTPELGEEDSEALRMMNQMLGGDNK